MRARNWCKILCSKETNPEFISLLVKLSSISYSSTSTEQTFTEMTFYMNIYLTFCIPNIFVHSKDKNYGKN